MMSVSDIYIHLLNLYDTYFYPMSRISMLVLHSQSSPEQSPAAAAAASASSLPVTNRQSESPPIPVLSACELLPARGGGFVASEFPD
jgi:hypothetical protein